MPQVQLGRPATYDDLVAVPEHLVAEIVDGELWTSPRPAPVHARAHTRVSSLLEPPFDQGRGGPGGWQILIEPELHLGHDVLVPDLAGWRRERMAALPETPYFSMAPDWVCEILSPSTALLDRTRKLRVYAREGVRWTWLIDPLARTLEVLRLDGGQWVVAAAFGGAAAVRAEPFEALEIQLDLLWADHATHVQP